MLSAVDMKRFVEEVIDRIIHRDSYQPSLDWDFLGGACPPSVRSSGGYLCVCRKSRSQVRSHR
jgi:hypothetical protein